MHISLPCRVGSLIISKEVYFSGVRSLIEVRRVQDRYMMFIVDDVPPSLASFDPEYVLHLILNRGLSIKKALEVACKDLGVDADHEIVSSVWTRWFTYYGSLTPLLLLDSVTDIYVRLDGVTALHVDLGLMDVKLDFPSQTISIRRLFRRESKSIEFDINKFVRYIIRRVSERTRSPITSYMPLLSATDSEFKARFSLSIEPISIPYVHIRILPKTPWTLSKLIQLDALSISQAALLWYLFDLKVPILIIGPMGGGKTSLANAITFNSCPELSKVLIMDVDEMYLPGHNVIKLFERKSYGLGIRPITKDILIAHALRMGVDYIIVNEVRTREEVRAWLDAVTTGHGGVTTFHAANLQTLKIRLENMLGRPVNIEEEIAIVKTNIHYVTVQSNDGVKVRRAVRRVVDIIVPRHVKVYREEVEVRAMLLSKMMELNINQQLTLLSSFYRESEKVLEEVSRSL